MKIDDRWSLIAACITLVVYALLLWYLGSQYGGIENYPRV